MTRRLPVRRAYNEALHGGPVTSLLRSLLFVPGVRPDRFASADASGADAVVFDLEDSVDAARKAEARRAVAAFVSAAPRRGAQRFVRVNSARSHWWTEDLAFVESFQGFDGIVVPKAEFAGQIEQAARAAGGRQVLPLLETARGVLNAPAIASAAAPIPALLFGAEDLTAELGVPRTVDGEELLFARSQVVLAAATIGAEPIDAVFVDIEAPDDLRRDAERARALGYRGKMAIHPGQIVILHEVFSPSAADITRARHMVEAFDAATARRDAVIRFDDRMVDAPVVARARRVLALADRIAGATAPRTPS